MIGLLLALAFGPTLIAPEDISTELCIAGETVIVEDASTETFTCSDDVDLSTGTLLIPSGTSNPGSCTEAAIFFDTDDDELNVCSGVDTWTPITGGSGGLSQTIAWKSLDVDAVTVVKGNTDYVSLFSPVLSATRTEVAIPMARAGTLTDFQMYIAGNTLDCETSTATVMDDTTATTLATTILSTTTGWTTIDTDEYALTDGNLVSLRVINCAGGGGAKDIDIGGVSLGF